MFSPACGSLQQLNQILATKEAQVGQLVNATEKIFMARCAGSNLCVANKTVCTQPACGSNFLNTPGLTCDFKFGSNKSLCGKRCSGMLRSIESSTVQVAPGLENNQEAATFTCSTASLTSLFKELYVNQGITGWQYVASNTGVTRTYPAAAQSGSTCTKQDQRQQAWYVSAATGPKDIIFVCDYSDSMNAGDAGPNGMTRLTALKRTMNLLLNSLTEADRFNVVTFAGGATALGPSDSLLSGSAANVSYINNIVQQRRTSGGTRFGPGFNLAFSLFTSDAASSTGCTRIIMFLTDGQPTDGNAYVSAIANGQAALGSNPAVMFTYSMSRSADESLMKDIACDYKGFWAPVRDGSAANNPVQQYYNWIAQGILRPRPRWTNPTISSWGQGPIVTVSQPMFDYTSTPKVFMGVAAIDVLMSELLAVATEAEILAALKARSDVCLDYDLTPCQRQMLRRNATVAFSCPSPEPTVASCAASTSVTPPSCNTTIITNINQVLCEPYNNYTALTQNDTKMQCCQQSQCFTRSRSISGPTPSLTQLFSKTDSLSGSSTGSNTLPPTPSPSDKASASGTLTETLLPTPSSTDVVTATEKLTASIILNKTTTISGTPSLGATQSAHVVSETFVETLSLESSTTITLSATPSSTANLTATLALTESVDISKSQSWQCVQQAALLRVLNFTQTIVTITDTDVINGFNQTFELPPRRDVEDPTLHIPWFQPFTVTMFAVKRPTTPANEKGFARLPGYTANITAFFARGVGSSTLARANETTIVSLVSPPHPDFEVYAGEAIDLNVNISDLTLGHLCETPQTTTMMQLVLLLINTPNSQFIGAAQELITSTIIAATATAAAFGGAAPDMQVFVMLSSLPCADSYQRRAFQMYRALSPFAISDSYEGILWGNLVANIGVLTLHTIILLAVSFFQKVSLAASAEMVRFPNLSLQMMIVTYPSTAFATAQTLTDKARTSQQLFLGLVMLVLFVIGYPAGVLLYIMRNVEATFDRFEYHRWRREASALRVRLLSRVMLPVGSWGPSHVRRCFGTVVTLQCRPEYLWLTYPAWSAMIVSIISLFDFNSKSLCLVLYSIMFLLHLLIIAAIVYFKPFRSLIEDWFSAIAVVLTTVCIVIQVVNLQLPASSTAQGFLWFVAIAQWSLLVVRQIYHIAIIFIARNLRHNVPHVEAFSWNLGSVDKNDELDNGDDIMNALLTSSDPYGGQLGRELEDLLNMTADDNAEDVVETNEVPRSDEWWKDKEEETKKPSQLPTDSKTNEAYMKSLYNVEHNEEEIDALLS